MNPLDFKGLYFYKLLIPAFTWGSILGTFLGPFFFPEAWFLFVAAFMVVFVLVSLSQLRRMLDMISRIQQTIARSVPVTKALADECEQRQRCFRGFSRKKVLQAGSLELSNATNGDAGKQIAVDLSVPFLHAFVIPNYKEPMSVLKSTLQQLADHKTAVERYLIVLAMEVAEDGHEAKAQKLSEEFKGRFKHILWTSHRQKLGEMRGKASNVDWAAREGAKEFRRLGLDVERIMVTNMDADAQVPSLYVQEVDHAAAAAEDPHLLVGTHGILSMHLIVTLATALLERGFDLGQEVYAAPILFERNAYDVPVFTRVHDFMWSAMAMQNLGSPMQLGFPISNYTLSLALLERIDFWDTTEDAIGEDFHMFVKAYFKTHGQVRLASIPAPVNMLNLQAGGYWETIKARMVQAERHARGCADFAYCLKHARSMPHFSWRTVALCLKVLEAQMLPACAPFYMGLAAGWGVLVSKYVEHSALSLMGLNFIKGFGFMGLPIFVSLAACNEVVRRYVRPRLYNTKNMPLWRCADYAALAVDVWVFMVLPTVFALTKSILPISQGEYVVAEKIVTEDEEKVLLIGPLSSGSLHSMGTHDSSSSLDWALDAAGNKEQVGDVVLDMAKAGLGVEVHTRPRGTNDWRETPASEVLDARTLKAAAPAVTGPPPPPPISTATWVDTPAQLPSTNGQAPIRSRACVSRSTSNASPNISSVAADARNSPSRDSTPRKADRLEIAKFFSGWMSPVLGSLRA